jgi:hypothetical protein
MRVDQFKPRARKGITFLAIVALLAVSGLASASSDTEEDSDDTVFNFAYDEEFHVFLWNITANDGTYDCSLENGELTATYGETTDDVIAVDDLTDESDETVTFENRPPDEVDQEEYDVAEEPIPYSGADGECGLSGGEVTGPNGQVNHGMFLKLFNSLYEGTGRGCLVRYIAQSDLGKGDQQINVSDVDDQFESAEAGDEGTVDFSTFSADCERGKSGEARNSASNGRGRPEFAGKSGEAPGRNK